MEAYSQTLCTWVGRKAGEWNGCGRYYENEDEMRVRKPEEVRQCVKQTKEGMIYGIYEF